MAFRRETGTAAQRLKWWRRRLGATSATNIESVPVEVAPSTAGTADGDGVMEIVLGAIRVRVGRGFDAAALRRLLDVLGGQAC